jgi:DNA-binding transcriptional MerR regulator
MNDKPRFSSGQVCTLLDISLRQLDWWCRHGLIRPSHIGPGTGYPRCYSTQDLIRIAAITRMRDIGLDLHVIKGYLRRGEEAVLVGQPLPQDLPEGIEVPA